MACGPVRNSYNHRRNRVPMRLKQRLPDADETSISASGHYVGRVRRGSEAYRALETNFNTDIVFKDDEKNGDGRRMTKVTCFLHQWLLHKFVILCTLTRRKKKKKQERKKEATT